MPVITCPNCGTRLNAPDSLLGQQVTCGKCRCLFIAQSQTPPSVQAVAAQEQPPAETPPAGTGFASPPPPPPPMFPPPPLPGQEGYQQVTGGYYQPAPLATSGYAVASLVLGIASIATVPPCCGLPALICGPMAMVFSSHAMRDIRSGTANPSSAGLAKGGKICGLVGLLLGIGFLILIAVGITVSIMTND